MNLVAMWTRLRVRAMTVLVSLAMLMSVSTVAFGQTEDAAAFRLAVIVSDVGANAEQGLLERRVAEAWAARQRGRGGIFGRTVEIDVRSDGGSIERAVRLAEISIDLGTHAIVCCSVPAASVLVADVAAEAGVPMLALTGMPGSSARGWAHGLAPDDTVFLQAVVRDAYARGLLDLGLMTIDGAFGSAVRERIEGLLAAPGLRIVSDVRYPADATVLTPEALRSAVAEPDAMIVWGLRDDTFLAIDGLRSRGWTGPVYLRPAVLDAATGGIAGGLGTISEGIGDVRVLVSPASLTAATRNEADAASATFEARALGGGSLESRPLRADGARTYDALTVLAAAFEQVSMYGIDLSDPRSVRSALRDALIGLPPRTLAAGTYDLGDDASVAARAEGLVAARIDGRQLVPLD